MALVFRRLTDEVSDDGGFAVVELRELEPALDTEEDKGELLNA